MGALDGLRVVSFEARRADELATMLARHGADVVRAPALRETPLPPATALMNGLTERGLRTLRVPVYRWALPADPGPLRAAAEAIADGRADVAVFTNSAQVEHLFQVAREATLLRSAFGRTVVASVGP